MFWFLLWFVGFVVTWFVAYVWMEKMATRNKDEMDIFFHFVSGMLIGSVWPLSVLGAAIIYLAPKAIKWLDEREHKEKEEEL